MTAAVGSVVDAAPPPETRSRRTRFIRFALVGVIGLVVNQVTLWTFTAAVGLHYLLSAVVATQCSTLAAFALMETWVFPSPPTGRGRRLVWFVALNNGWLLLRGPVLFALTDLAGVHYLISNVIAIGSATVARFVVADARIWRVARDDDIWTSRSGAIDDVFRYDVHGIVRIRSDAPLPELERFRTTSLETPDLTIAIGGRGFGGLRRRAAVDRDPDAVRYVEQLGRLGFGARVEFGETMQVRATRLLAWSPHVLYTNVVEPVLRWLLVRHGYILAHAACLDIDGRGVLITARTDTGKTTTCLMSMKEHGTGFVSDDMVIVSPDGTARGYPKPLTVSAHTLRAIRGAPIPPARRIWLSVQSRLHSKTGRRIGLSFTKWNIPVCTMNAVVQLLIPPPKFDVAALIPTATLTDEIELSHLVVIEHGDGGVDPIPVEEAVEVLRLNTEDAYGFPPYPVIADALANGEGRIERDIRRRVVEKLTVTRLRSPDRSWYEALPSVVASTTIPTTSMGPGVDASEGTASDRAGVQRVTVRSEQEGP